MPAGRRRPAGVPQASRRHPLQASRRHPLQACRHPAGITQGSCGIPQASRKNSSFFSSSAPSCADCGVRKCLHPSGLFSRFQKGGEPKWRTDGPPSSFPPTHRPRETPGGISDARPHYSRTALHLASLSTHDEPCGCTSLHFQPVTNTAAALRFTFNPGRTLRLRFASLSTHDEHRSLGWPRGRPRGWLRHACGMRGHPRDACGMPAGDARGMPAACLRHACGLQACFRHSAGHACGLRRHSPAGIRFASPGQQNGENA